ncbi:paraquat-inducible protein A [Desulfogranum marinum]|uniref:paraquat-inducible protein A n=1 Tax=Desulfogranum marinum TaxID=453220 RepID=UPI0019646257|nr:paraquat-inducible protein A [Desulfogranum marinum]MBM9513962.1 paraquat-inducible protein A [Desulfogranum marinum]
MEINRSSITANAATAREMGLVSCHRCHLLCKLYDQKSACPRCGTSLHSRKKESVARTWALVIAASIFYIPANILPVTYTTSLGTVQSDTIMSGVIYFIHSDSWPIALVIFVASIFVPLLKLVILITLLLSVQLRWISRAKDFTRLYRLTELVGRWSMLDIYVITVLVALVHFDALADIEAGMGALFFAMVVVITMFAAESFDPRLIWDNLQSTHEEKY